MSMDLKSPEYEAGSSNSSFWDLLQDSLGVILAIVFLLGSFLILNYFNVVQIYRVVPVLSFLPHQKLQLQPSSTTRAGKSNSSTPTPTIVIPLIASVDNCMADKNSNPIIHDLGPYTLPNKQTGKIGTFLGTVNKYTYSSASKTASFELDSTKGDQHQNFTFTEKAGLVNYGGTNKQAKLSDLKTGTSVTISFTCIPSNAQLQVTNIAIN